MNILRNIQTNIFPPIATTEQEALIRTLATQDATRNKTYTRLFLALPLLSIPAYIRELIQPITTTNASSSHHRLLALLSITSLLSTAYILYRLPTGRTGIPGLEFTRSITRSGGIPITTPQRYDGKRRSHTALVGDAWDQGPLERYLPALNLLLVAVLALAAPVLRPGPPLGWALLPAGVYGVILIVNVVMGGVDVGELESLKYGYRGA
ncbi:MAG: hypothetical protein M1818_005371 [Claussenomyces sp. TS43310]|nr:MAG: hypothetical protein M1818_005371 [Claussenomyces sp. TS43310]